MRLDPVVIAPWVDSFVIGMALVVGYYSAGKMKRE